MNKHVRQLRFNLSDFIDDAVKAGATISSVHFPVILGYAGRMQSAPAFLHEVLFGSHEWSDSIDAEDLWQEAERLMIDRAELHGLENLSASSDNDRLLKLIAATWASYCLIDTQRATRRAFEDAWDERGEINYGRLYT